MSACPAHGGSPGDALIEGLVKADDFLRRQEPGEAGPRVHPRTPGRVQGDVAGGDGMVHDLAENFQCPVGISRSRDTVAVEPGIHVCRSDPVEWQAPERRKQLVSEKGSHVFSVSTVSSGQNGQPSMDLPRNPGTQEYRTRTSILLRLRRRARPTGSKGTPFGLHERSSASPGPSEIFRV